jgi:hypothetical protein
MLEKWRNETDLAGLELGYGASLQTDSASS